MTIYEKCCCCSLVAQLWPTLGDHMDCGPPGPSVHGIFQATILEFSFSSPMDLLDPRIEPMSPALQVDSLLLSHLGSPFLKDSRHQTGEEKKTSVFSQGVLLHCGT